MNDPSTPRPNVQTFGRAWWRVNILLIGMTSAFAIRAGSSEVSTTCPSPEDLLEGVEVLCGTSLVVGTGLREAAPPCSTDGETGCITTDVFQAAERAVINAADIKQGIQVAGVAGTFRQEIDSQRVVACAADGQAECYVSGSLVALDLRGFEDKLLAGELVAGVSGTAVAGDPKTCSSIGDTECLTVGDWPAIEGSRLASCLGGGGP